MDTFPIVRVAKCMQLFPINIDFFWGKVSHGNVTHIESDGSVTEYREVVFGAKEPFFDGFWRLVPAL